MNTARYLAAVALAAALAASPAAADELPPGVSFSDGPSAAPCPADPTLDDDQVECEILIERIAQLEAHERWAREDAASPAEEDAAPRQPPAPPTPPLDELPETGLGVTWLAALGSLLALVGAATTRRTDT